MYSAVNMIKNNYVNRTFGLLGGVPVIQEMNHEELENFLSKTTKVLDGMRKVPPKQAVLLSKYFKKEASEIVKILKRIEDNLKEMKGLLADGKSIPLVSKITSRVDVMKGMNRKFRDLEQQEKILKEKTEKTGKEKERKEEDLKKLMKSEGYREHVDSSEKIRDLKREREDLTSEIREEFSSVKRPMKKYEHVLRSDSSIPREKRISFERMIHSPVKAILSEDGESVLKDIIYRVDEAIEKRMVSLKDSEMKKFREFSERVREGKISDVRKKHMELKERIEESERGKEKSGVIDEREKIKREIEHSGHEISEYKRNLESISKGKESVKKEIIEEKKRLEKMIESEIGKRFVIKMF